MFRVRSSISASVGNFSARLYIKSAREFAHPATWADMAAIVSFLAPIVGEGLGFLRILRTLRVLHTYQVIVRFRAANSLFRRNEEVITGGEPWGVHLYYHWFLDSALAQSGDRLHLRPGRDRFCPRLSFR